MSPCRHWINGRYCGAEPARYYIPGWRCAAHTPAALNGRPECQPPPETTLAGLLERSGRVAIAAPMSASQLIHDRAVASGKSRRGAHAYQEARIREQKRREIEQEARRSVT